MKYPAKLTLPVSLVEIDPLAIGLFAKPAQNIKIYTSLEGKNPGGSIKDRMVVGELMQLIEAGSLRQGGWIAEISSGSTARSLAHYCALLGIHCALFVPSTLPEPDLRRLRESGAEVHPVDAAGAYQRFQEFCLERGMPAFNQLFDASKRRHYHSFGRALQRLTGGIDWLIGAVGTGHSLSGTGAGMSASPLLMTAEPAKGKVSGIRNIELERHGPADPCVPVWFDRRVLVEDRDWYSRPSIETGGGHLVFSESFRLVLGALNKIAGTISHSGGPVTVFLLGAQNRIEFSA